MKCLLLSTIIFMASNANAVIFLKKDQSDSNGSNQISYQPPEDENATELASSDEIKCEDGNRVSLGLIKQIMPKHKDIKVSFEGSSKKSAKIVLPKYNTTCMKLSLSYHKVDNDIFIMATNNYDLSSYPGDTPYIKYEQCLLSNKVISSTGQIEANAGEIADGYIQSFPVEFDANEDVNIHFASPSGQFQDYAEFEKAEKIGKSPVDCTIGETIAEGGLKLFSSPVQAGVNYFEKACNSNDHLQMYNALKELNENKTGNAKNLTDETRSIMTQILKEKLDKSTAENKEEWDKRAKELCSELRKAKSEDDVQYLTEDLLEIMRTIDKFVLDPMIADLVALYDSRKTAQKEQKKEIDKQIKKLNEEIAKYSNKGSYITNSVIEKVLEFGLKDEADELFGLKLKSAHYGQLNFGQAREGYPQDPKKIKAAIEQKMNRFDEVSTEKQREYSATNGGEKYSKEYAQKAQKLMQRRNMMREKDMDRISQKQQDLQRYCKRTFWGGVANKSGCISTQNELKTLMGSADKRLARYNKEIMQATGRADKFYKLEQKYASTLVEDRYEFTDDFSYFLDANYDYTGASYDFFSGSGLGGLPGEAPQFSMPGFSQQQSPEIQFISSPFSASPVTN